uniref:ATP synthase complex subunit 8 n=1 Tax=Parribacus antarcticus TaxID=196017 RepID=A0A515L342_PARAT|nr:ATP synthase F0 subunit 8 [Parribacus antarcticus]QDM38487.1 ATP synthase F0 subunit 8 [Parribacus antarcticus]
MPQMAPLMWLILFFMFLFSLFCFSIVNYFFISPENEMTLQSKSVTIQKLWKW